MNAHIGTTTSAKDQTAVLAWEVNQNFTRGSRTLSATVETDVPVGTLIANDGTSDVILDPAGSDGSEVVVGVVLNGGVIQAGGSRKFTTLENGDALIKETGIEWAAATDTQKTSIRAALRALNIKITASVGHHV